MDMPQSARKTRQARKTKETDIRLSLNIDGTGVYRIKTGIGFFDHMLSLFAKHGLFDLTVEGKGDLEVDAHHTVEDVGIVLGQAFRAALGEKRGIRRYGFAYVPMDESLARVCVDLSGRSYLVFKAAIKREKVGDFDTEVIQEFFKAFADNAMLNLNIELLHGGNAHHNSEAIFKAWALAMREATTRDARIKGVQSTKGTI
jgi:imidazoleglycerol-phosphate dehydratase